MTFDVIIIGAGVIGGMLARELSRYQLSICVLEKENDVAMGASRANSGIIHGGYDPEPGTLKAMLNSKGVELLFAVARELHVPCIRNGSMVCAFSSAEDAMLQKLYQRGLVNSTPGMQILTGDEARQLEPNLSPRVTSVLRVPNAGIVGPYELTIAAMGNAMDNGAQLKRNFKVCKIQKEAEIFTLSDETGQSVRGRFVVNCAGCYSDQIAQLVGDDFFSITPRAGEYMLLDKAEGSRVSHTLFQCPSADGKGILVSPTVHGNLLTGPTASIVACPENRDTTPQGLEAVRRLSAKSVPSIDFRQVITSFTGVRATGSTGDFIIAQSRKMPGVFHLAAIESPGLTCCVAIAEYATALLGQCGLALQKKSYWDGTRADPCAFQKMTDEEKDAYIRENPDYGKIICRCETISRGEILRAIRQNPGARDLDGIKRRTRSGMGRCQGGFCTPYVMGLLQQELHIPITEVTKSGIGSETVFGRIGEV